MSIVDNNINKIDELGDLFIKKYLIPTIKRVGVTLIEDNQIYKYFVNIKTAFIEDKLSIFIGFLKKISETEILDYISNMNKQEQKHFINIINKVIEMDDELQIYILACLTKQYQINKKLDYYETQLFYNINSISKMDFEIFYNIFQKENENNKQKISINLKRIDEITNISLNKFLNLGLLTTKQNSNVNGKIVIKNDFYKESEYSKQLFLMLDNFFNSSI